MFPPENTCRNPGLFPCGLAWSKTYTKTKEKRGQVMTFRRWLHNLTGVVVHWDRWAKLEVELLARSREATQSRVLLECPLGWQWYLGDRVTRSFSVRSAWAASATRAEDGVLHSSRVAVHCAGYRLGEAPPTFSGLCSLCRPISGHQPKGGGGVRETGGWSWGSERRVQSTESRRPLYTG
ncbi:hypothetical protein RHMOL_Rhmol01G0146000 [Rhododendron molle]|uniref:Uncharacterized protein n=1 Tax=Rhododendron molle TaxID=49168 RepID=A0ACC0Q306_RHOML|nr:hypothetical protein RHMOL_Rhmol01G0146000 [Rhododendron molle]